MPTPSTYTFGDTDLAARRLALVAETFAGTSAAFMREFVTTRPQLAADLGCGPGYTTHLLADTLKPDRTVGLDNSENFLCPRSYERLRQRCPSAFTTSRRPRSPRPRSTSSSAASY